MIEITQEEADKLSLLSGTIAITDINGGKFILVSGVLFIINPRKTDFTEHNDDTANYIPA